jgi:hypothetical protein
MTDELVENAHRVAAAAPENLRDPPARDRLPVLLWGLLTAGCALVFGLDAVGPNGARLIHGHLLGVSFYRLGLIEVLLLCAVAFAMLLRAAGLSPRIAPLAATFTIDWRRRSAFAIAVGVALSLAAVWALRAFPNSGDEYDYLFQAKTFLAGRLWNPPPPVPELFSFFHISLRGSKWVTFYPPGWPLLLMAGMALRLPAYLVCPLAGGLLLFVVLKLGERRDGALGGLLAVILLALSPFFIFNAGSYFNHVPAAAAGLMFCWAAIAFLDRPRPSTAWLAGIALGVLGLIRPADVPIFAVPFLAEFCWRAGRRHYRLAPMIVLAGLPFLAILLLYYSAITGALLPNPNWESPTLQFGLSMVDEQGRHVHLVDQLWAALTQITTLAEWTSPLLVLGFAAAFVRLAVGRRLSFVDLVFPAFVIGYMLVPFDGGNQYGPRYYFEAFPCLVLTLVSGITPLLGDAANPQRTAFAWFLLLAHGAVSIAGVVIIGFWMRAVIDQRMDIYDQVQAEHLRNAVVVVHSSTGSIAPMDPRDLTRNGIDADGEVIYVIDLPDKLPALQQLFPQRRFYVYEREAGSPKGALRPLQRPGFAATD